MSFLYTSYNKIIFEYGIDKYNVPKKWTFHRVLKKKEKTYYWISNIQINKKKLRIYLSSSNILSSEKIIEKINSFIDDNDLEIEIPKNNVNFPSHLEGKVSLLKKLFFVIPSHLCSL